MTIAYRRTSLLARIGGLSSDFARSNPCCVLALALALAIGAVRQEADAWRSCSASPATVRELYLAIAEFRRT